MGNTAPAAGRHHWCGEDVLGPLRVRGGRAKQGRASGIAAPAAGRHRIRPQGGSFPAVAACWAGVGRLNGGRRVSVGGVTIEDMRLTTRDIERIPLRHLRVPLREFVAVWVTAEQRVNDETSDWWTAGVVQVCRWLARAPVRPNDGGRWYVARSPITRRENYAYEELIEAECVAAEVMLLRRPPHIWLTDRPGWIEGMSATLNWAWRRQGDPPLDIRHWMASEPGRMVG